MPTRAAVESAALQLDAHDRARLVDVLVTSLAVEHGVDDAWFGELEARVEEVQAGASIILGADSTATSMGPTANGAGPG